MDQAEVDGKEAYRVYAEKVVSNVGYTSEKAVKDIDPVLVAIVMDVIASLVKHCIIDKVNGLTWMNSVLERTIRTVNPTTNQPIFHYETNEHIDKEVAEFYAKKNHKRCWGKGYLTFQDPDGSGRIEMCSCSIKNFNKSNATVDVDKLVMG